MTEDLRALMRAELNDQRPPPLGDLVSAALRDGRRIRRRRRVGASVAGALGVVALLLTGGIAALPEPRTSEPAAVPPVPAPAETPFGRVAGRPAAVSPGSVPFGSAAPTTLAPERTLAIRSGTHDADGTLKKATTGAMLRLLTQLLPEGTISGPAVADTGKLGVEVLLDRGNGPGTIRLGLEQAGTAEPRPPRGGTATVTIGGVPSDCARTTVVTSRWPDGTTVRLDVGTCLALKSGTDLRRPVLSTDEAAAIAADPQWGLAMDADLVVRGDEQFGRPPVFGP